MKTSITKEFLATSAGQEADRILRSCVHCGFCTATCPTYQLLGDELDGPRGRIYLIKQMLEGDPVTRRTQQHLDRCLTCRSCETTCPSGVEYGKLVDIGREIIDTQVKRPILEDMQRFLLRKLLPYPNRIIVPLRIGQWLKPLLPALLKQKIPAKQTAGDRPAIRHKRTMLLMEGCAQSLMTPTTNAATSRVLDRLGISVISPASQGCCGAVSQHLSAAEEAQQFMRRNIDAWWPYIEAGAEAIISTASGCGVLVKDYGHLLRNDLAYADKAKRVAALTQDLSEIIADENVEQLLINHTKRFAFHSPCTLQHGQQLNGKVENILHRVGIKLTDVDDKHLCCGSAGTYSVLQAELSGQLLNNKLAALTVDKPDEIITANVGCQLHLCSKSKQPVRHWIELLDKPD